MKKAGTEIRVATHICLAKSRRRSLNIKWQSKHHAFQFLRGACLLTTLYGLNEVLDGPPSFHQSSH